MAFHPTNLPASVYSVYTQGPLAWPLVVREAILAGIRDLTKLTDIVFYLHYPDRIGRPLDSTETGLIEKWKGFRTLIRPVLSASPMYGDNDEDRIDWKLRQARDSDEIEYMDIDGSTVALIDLLLKPNSNDRYFPDYLVKDYIDNCPGDRPPRDPDEIAKHMKYFVKNNGLKKHSVREFIEFLQQDVRERIVGGMGQFRMTDEWTRLMIDDSGTIGPGAAYKKLMAWFLKQKYDTNSIYSCIGTDVDITN